MLRLRLRLRCRDGGSTGMHGSTGMQGTAAAGEPGARRARLLKLLGTLGEKVGEEVGCEVILQTPPLFK